MGVSLLLLPVSASASWLFSSAQAAGPASDTTLVPDASLPLLDAPLNTDPSAGANAGDLAVSSDALVPADGPDGSLPPQSYTDPTVAADNDATISTYTVQDGDSISGIAAHFGVSVNTILWANDLTVKSTIKPGETLVILPVTGIVHTVKSGETLSSIAAALHADAGEIATFNGLDANATVVVGQQLVIPDGELASAPSSASVPSASHTSTPSTKSAKVKIRSDIALPSGTSGYYENPAPGAILSQGLHGNNAVDLAAPIGTPIHAAAAGTVIVSKGDGAWNGGYGSYVVVSHDNGTQTLYAHMSKDAATVGETVSQGEVIGYIGETGEATGPHVHFEVRGAKNPFAYDCALNEPCD